MRFLPTPGRASADLDIGQMRSTSELTFGEIARAQQGRLNCAADRCR
jgi:hypothetical protein